MLRYNLYETVLKELEDMRELLKELGWSQAYFAQRVGVSVQTVNHWCQGKPNPVAMAYLELVKRILG
jgi:DNA-binding transcriptional regulator YiaG